MDITHAYYHTIGNYTIVDHLRPKAEARDFGIDTMLTPLAPLSRPQCFQTRRINGMDNTDDSLPDLLVDTSIAVYKNCFVFDHGIKFRGPEVLPTQPTAMEQSEDNTNCLSCHPNSGDSGFVDCTCRGDKMNESTSRTGVSTTIELGPSSHTETISSSLVRSPQSQVMAAPNPVSKPPVVPTFDWTAEKSLVVKLPPLPPRSERPQEQLQVPLSHGDHTNPFRASNSNPFSTPQDNTRVLDTNPFRQSISPVSLPATNPFLDIDTSTSPNVSTNPFLLPDRTFIEKYGAWLKQLSSPSGDESSSIFKRLTTPGSHRDLFTLATAMRHLEMSDFYYPHMGMQEAKEQLRDSPEGTFLVRNSSQPNYLFTISVKTCRGSTSVRVEYTSGRFRLDTEVPSRTRFPSFDCIIKLLQFYVKVSTGGQGGSCVYAETSGRRDTPVIFQSPLRQGVTSLGHLTRRTIHRNVARGNIEDLPVPQKVVNYLLEYPFWL